MKKKTATHAWPPVHRLCVSALKGYVGRPMTAVWHMARWLKNPKWLVFTLLAGCQPGYLTPHVEPCTWYPDQDGDGYGAMGQSFQAGCQTPQPGYAADASDCDDDDGQVNPAAEEICGDGVDNDCSGDAAGCGRQGELEARLADGRYLGSVAETLAGYAVAGIGDQDGDGYDDIAVGVPGEQNVGTGSTAVALFRGPALGQYDLEQADWRLLRDGDSRGAAGVALASAGDLDGDGIQELLVGALSANGDGNDGGAAFLVQGPLTDDLSLADSHAMLCGVNPENYAGYGLAAAGDTDGDGQQEFLVGAPEGGAQAGGAVYLLQGMVAGTVSLASAVAVLEADTHGDWVGESLAGGSDLNGDGMDELLIGGENDEWTVQGGVAWIVSGPVVGTFVLDDVGLPVAGSTAGAKVGHGLAAVGDSNGDGYGDLLVGGPGSSGGAGSAWLLLGPADDWTGLADASATIVGAPQDQAGSRVLGPGDLDADGLDDLVVAAPGNGVVASFSGLVSGTLALSEATLLVFSEPEGGSLGTGLAAAGDVDGDGQPDFLLGDPAWGSGSAGAAYLVLGALEP